MIPENDNEALCSSIAVTPVSVSIWATNKYFRHYKTGVLSKCGGVPKDPSREHAVLAIGYGTDGS